MRNSNYIFEKYCSLRRWDTYWYQIKYCREVCTTGSNILLIGPGDWIVVDVLRGMEYNVEVFDIRPGADIKGNILDIKRLVTKHYDVVICCEVLEHVGFGYAEGIVEHLKTIADKRLIISIPIYKGVVDRYHQWELGSTEETKMFDKYCSPCTIDIVHSKWKFYII